MSNPIIHATVDRLEDDKAVLRLLDEQELIVDLKYLPVETTEGSILDLCFEVSGEAEKKAETKARQLLNQILKSS